MLSKEECLEIEKWNTELRLEELRKSLNKVKKANEEKPSDK